MDLKALNPLYYLWGDFFQNEKSKDTLRQVLKNNVLFKHFTNREIATVEKVVHLRQYQPGELIFRQNEKGIGMYIISEGSVSIKVLAPEYLKSGTEKNPDVDSPEKSAEDVHETLVTVLKKGSFFGELALIDAENKRTASVYANEYTT